ncbi:MAG: ABC transporter substrate-binding protein [Stomatobaculum sp.]|nr:ABC transporter substrate-binding protein [Stomatobaculum sp.]
MKRFVTRNMPAALILSVCAVVFAGCGGGQGAAAPAAETTAAAETTVTELQAPAAAETAAAAKEKSTDETTAVGTAAVVDVVAEAEKNGGLHPVSGTELKPGDYDISVDSSSSMFRITDCVLTVEEDGTMRALITMSGSGYAYVYPGTAEEAAEAAETDRIPAGESPEGTNTFEVPLDALDEPVPLAAFSRKKELWYDRTLLFRASSLPEEACREARPAVTAESLGLADGTYTAEVFLEGGSGRAKVASPARIFVKNGAAEAEIIWGSANYDYMKVDGDQYFAEITDGHSVVVIPLKAFDRPLPVIADTTAMSQPHEIEYTLTFDSATLTQEGESPQSKGEEKAEEQTSAAQAEGKETSARMELSYAEGFAVEYEENGCARISIRDEGEYLLVPEGGTLPASLPEGVTVLSQPLENIYLADSGAMDFFLRLEALPRVGFTGTRQEDWTLSKASEAMAQGSLVYAGKYSAPDYEMLLEAGCSLAIENTMIHHNPEAKEQLEALGIPVLVGRMSYERHPLGRLEWVKLYGLLAGKEAEAEQFFREQCKNAEAVIKQQGAEAENTTGREASSRPKTAFFYFSPNGYVNVRRPEDYLPKMIELAGGEYFLENTEGEESARSTMNLQAETFYEKAKDADVLIYNATIDGGIRSREDLLRKAPWLADFKAVKNGAVWRAGNDMFQQSSGIAEMILELRQILENAASGSDSGKIDGLQYFQLLL